MNLALRLLLLFTLALGAEIAQAVELIADPSFNEGFTAKDRAGKQQVIQWKKDRPPVWDVAQHYSKNSITDPQWLSLRSNGLTFRGACQIFIAHPEEGGADIIMGVNAFKEFGGIYRKNGEPWPHEYVSQRISNPKGHLGSTSPQLSEIEHIDLSLDMRLLYDRSHQSIGYNPQLHAALFLLFFTVQNLNPHSKGFGDYYWFGIGLYDSRERITRPLVHQDKGSALKQATDKLIYDVGIAPFTNKIVADGNWVTVRGDILPYIRAGLEESWKQGFLPESKDLADYRIGEITLGWEITGLNDAAVAVKNLRATALLKEK